MADYMDVDHTPLLHEDPTSTENAVSQPSKWPVMTVVHRFRLACALALERHNFSAHAAGEAPKLSKEWAIQAADKAKNLLSHIRTWHDNLLNRGHVFDEDRCVVT